MLYVGTYAVSAYYACTLLKCESFVVTGLVICTGRKCTLVQYIFTQYVLFMNSSFNPPRDIETHGVLIILVKKIY